MNYTTIQKRQEELAFLDAAIRAFKADVNIATFSGKIDSGELFAVRWGLTDDSIIVFRIGDDPPTLYSQALKEKGDE